ncbi:MAG: multicopper oxidase domain-containing protein, partial [Acidobacteriaceae bacterium]|nr:multicopper oxidase domain-containing protein [Acidobacteriaceae bacterium]
MALAAPGLRDTGLYGLSQMGQMAMPPQGQPAAGRRADITLHIEPVTVELAPDRILSTIGYNGSSPGPILRMKEGKPITVDVINRTDTPELVHWHGFLISPETDGVEEQGARPIPPQGTRRLQFTPALAASRWC